MSQRDELARRLAEIFVMSLKEPTVSTGFPSPSFYDMGAVADECIHQMRWVWHAARWSSAATMEYYQTVLEDGDLFDGDNPGFAPQGWKSEGLNELA